ncbi:MAG: hypothetical protein ABR915_23510 [Thermoguttaceae bacterium]
MSKTVRQLESAARAAHQAQTPWSVFWSQQGGHAIALEPMDRRGFKRLRNRLMMLVCCGDTDGQEPAGDGWPRPAPWEIDNTEAAGMVADLET